MKFAGKVALVTGASSGIGRASAVALAKEGADVALNYLTLPQGALEAKKEIEALGRKCLLYPVDLVDQDAVEKMVDDLVRHLGRIDILVSSAVFSDREYFHLANMEGFRKTIDVSMWGAFHALRACVRHMIEKKQGGSVVVVSSPHAVTPHPACMAYNMAKSALDSMAKTAAIELVKHKIRVNIVYPGWTDTPGERKYFTEGVLAEAARQLPVGRLAKSEEIARGVVFLADPASEYITGTILSIDGGSALPWWSKRGTGDF
ncbi:MAG: SDR family oxidoreductase [Gemmataceae bacterium]|nr:SDR family oxidoreductase [Gemmataceae bacterium]